jgi:hypothetical protein
MRGFYMKSIEETLLEFIMWEWRFYAYKKKQEKNCKDVADALTREEHQMLLNIYERMDYLHWTRVYSNPTVQKLMISEHITHKAI